MIVFVQAWFVECLYAIVHGYQEATVAVHCLIVDSPACQSQGKC